MYQYQVTIADTELALLAANLGQKLQAKGWLLVTAESCTGGWLAKAITDIPGSSAWLDRGFVTYSNESKQGLLKVTAQTLQTHGAVSEATVIAMAQGALAQSNAQVAITVSGIAGPGGGSSAKPVGTVWFAWVLPNQKVHSSCQYFGGDRNAVRFQAVKWALTKLLEEVSCMLCN